MKKEPVDNKVTKPNDFSDFAHEWNMVNDKDYRNKYEAMEKFVSEDLPLEDQSLNMMLAGGGLAPLVSYSAAPIHLAGRVARGVVQKDALRVLGVPNKKLLQDAAKGVRESRDKILWQATGNSVKVDQLSGNTTPQGIETK